MCPEKASDFAMSSESLFHHIAAAYRKECCVLVNLQQRILANRSKDLVHWNNYVEYQKQLVDQVVHIDEN